MTCGGCCGRSLHAKLTNLIKNANKHEGIAKDKFIVQLSSCITKDSYHGPPCPHLDYLKILLGKTGIDFLSDTNISRLAQKRRNEGLYTQ